MAYSDQSLLSQDSDFVLRIAACAAVEITMTPPDLPMQWATQNVWFIAAAPGFADKYAYAIQTGVPRPGNDPAVIADSEILAAVQHLEASSSQPTT